MLSCCSSCFTLFVSGFVFWLSGVMPGVILLSFCYSGSSDQIQILLCLCFFPLFESNKGLVALLVGNDLALHIRLGLTALFAMCAHDCNNGVSSKIRTFACILLLCTPIQLRPLMYVILTGYINFLPPLQRCNFQYL